MAETAFAPAVGIPHEALKVLFALEAGHVGDAGGSGMSLHEDGAFWMEARNSFDAERLELLDCVRQAVKRVPGMESGNPEREVCRELLAHLAGRSLGRQLLRIH